MSNEPKTDPSDGLNCAQLQLFWGDVFCQSAIFSLDQ